MNPIETYIFVDLGTTGKYAQVDNITELCMIAVRRKHLMDVATDARRDPRVQHKLRMCFNPEKEISYPAKRDGTGGFTNDDLQNESPFNQTTFDTINRFLNTLSAPMCLVAHYGSNFDYPILNRYLTRLGVRFPDDLRYVDSRKVFIVLEKETEKKEEEENVLFVKNTLPMKRQNETTPQKVYPNSSGSNENELPVVYRRVMGVAPIDSHKAEADCQMMMEIAVKFGEMFVVQVDKDQRRFNEVYTRAGGGNLVQEGEPPCKRKI